MQPLLHNLQAEPTLLCRLQTWHQTTPATGEWHSSVTGGVPFFLLYLGKGTLAAPTPLPGVTHTQAVRVDQLTLRMAHAKGLQNQGPRRARALFDNMLFNLQPD